MNTAQEVLGMKLVRLAGLVVLAPMVRTQVLYLSATLLVLIGELYLPGLQTPRRNIGV